MGPKLLGGFEAGRVCGEHGGALSDGAAGVGESRGLLLETWGQGPVWRMPHPEESELEVRVKVSFPLCPAAAHQGALGAGADPPWPGSQPPPAVVVLLGDLSQAVSLLPPGCDLRAVNFQDFATLRVTEGRSRALGGGGSAGCSVSRLPAGLCHPHAVTCSALADPPLGALPRAGAGSRCQEGALPRRGGALRCLEAARTLRPGRQPGQETCRVTSDRWLEP